MFEVREKPKMVERALLVGVSQGDVGTVEAESLLDELEELVRTLGIGVIGRELVRVREPQARFLMGSGKVDELVQMVEQLKADCIVFDAELSPAQQRNWEAASGICVIDRQEVILDIFSARARTREAVLQVDLARSEHSLPRLKNAWTHLSRQRGGGGVTQRGEGEAQIELDARMVRQRIARLKSELVDVVRHRETQRKQRQRVPVPSAAIVGYTNAGKSTLLNQLTGSTVDAEDKLFATLDPTTRQMKLPNGQKLLLTDTVGFVRRLPHQLVDAFKATLEEAIVADFLLHVVDVSNPEHEVQESTTLKVLRELGADEKRIITVYNKIDRLEQSPRGLFGEHVVCISAFSGEGIPRLLDACERFIEHESRPMQLCIPYDQYGLMHLLHSGAAIRSQRDEEDGTHVVANVPPRMQAQFEPFSISGA